MVAKAKLSRKNKKELKRKKSSKKNDFSKNEKTTTPDRNAPQNFESHRSIFDEGKKHIEELEPPSPNGENKVSTYYPNKYLFLQVIILLLFTVVVYFGTLDHSFHLDDKENIWNNSFIQISNLSLNDLHKAGFESVNRHRPVANISFALNYYFHGLDVRGFHLVNIFIHLLTGIILFYFIRTTLSLPLLTDRYSKSQFVPFLTALIWLVHPLHIQSVTYIVQRMNSMASMFFIMAMLFYVKGRLTPERVKKVLFFIISFVAAILAFGSKENTATLPLFILLYEWYFFQDLRIKISRKQFFWVAALGGTFAFIFYYYLGSSPLDRLFPDYGGRPFTMTQRLLTQPRVVLSYISLLLYPEPGRLNLDYDFPLSYTLFSPVTTFLSILLIIGLLGMAIYTAKENRLYSFCILWFLGNLVIESSTIPLEIIFEHRTYLPSMLVILLFVLFLYQTVKKKRVLIIFLVAMSMLFSYWTYERNKVWKDELTFWADNYKKSPNKPRVNQHFGTTLFNANRVDEAIPIFEKALRSYEEEIKLQTSVSSHKTSEHLYNLGIAYKEKGHYKKAILYLNRALEEFYYSARTHQHLGVSYAKTWQLEKAVFHLSKALEFTKHHSSDIDEKANVVEINRLLGVAKKSLEEKKKRELKEEK